MNIKTLVTFVVVVLLLVAGGTFAWFANQLRPIAHDEAPVTFSVEKGEGVQVIAQHLHENGLIRNELVFTVYAKVEGIAADFQAGDYRLQKSFSSQEIARLLSEGEVVGKEVDIKIVEGWSNRSIAEYIAAQRAKITHSNVSPADTEQFLDALNTTDSRALIPDMTYPFLASKPKGTTLEGFIFPDTYRIYNDFDPEQIIQKALDNFGKKIEPLLPEIQTSGHSLYELLTMASILEREAQQKSDMKNAADVFWKRIADGMPLQSDATLAYITGKTTGQITNADKQIDSPYNTYKYAGLPAGPIGNPSLAAIDAALHPTPNSYYYFLTKSDGTMVFAEILAEHNANKAKYLQ